MFKFNTQGIPDSRQCPITGRKRMWLVRGSYAIIAIRSDPFSFLNLFFLARCDPQGQVRGIIGRGVKEKGPRFSHRF
ncbi:hypothetical protein [Bacteroides acidifaciens]|uniref:hypothetical protein n=1 Tax=Bacteroides acidifaciens TaxID=85831 RepID=UPI003F6906C0